MRNLTKVALFMMCAMLFFNKAEAKPSCVCDPVYGYSYKDGVPKLFPNEIKVVLEEDTHTVMDPAAGRNQCDNGGCTLKAGTELAVDTLTGKARVLSCGNRIVSPVYWWDYVPKSVNINKVKKNEFVTNVYNRDEFVTNVYQKDSFITNQYVTDEYTTNVYTKDSFVTNVYEKDLYVTNKHVTNEIPEVECVTCVPAPLQPARQITAPIVIQKVNVNNGDGCNPCTGYIMPTAALVAPPQPAVFINETNINTGSSGCNGCPQVMLQPSVGYLQQGYLPEQPSMVYAPTIVKGDKTLTIAINRSGGQHRPQRPRPSYYGGHSQNGGPWSGTGVPSGYSGGNGDGNGGIFSEGGPISNGGVNRIATTAAQQRIPSGSQHWATQR